MLCYLYSVGANYPFMGEKLKTQKLKPVWRVNSLQEFLRKLLCLKVPTDLWILDMWEV